MQPSLFPPPDLTSVWVSRGEPRLWVRRLAIWERPGEAPLRNIILRRGLNIVWSPDPADTGPGRGQVQSIGHGGGKTLFCRLLRYCLGEPRFAPDDQREAVHRALPEGRVGAEVVLDGVPWAIVRPLGGSLNRRQVAVERGDLDALAAGEPPDTRMDPFLQAISNQLFGPDLEALLGNRAWLTALAWLTRDQECRFDDPLDWRSAESQSDSPTRSLSRTELLQAMRALIGALDPEEVAVFTAIGQAEDAFNQADRNRSFRAWDVTERRKALQLGGEEEDQQPNLPTAEEPSEPPAEPISAEALLRARNAYREAEVEVGRAETRLNLRLEDLPRLRGELTVGVNRATANAQPVCLLCEVPIDHVLAEGCKLSHTLPDLERIRADRDRLRDNVDRAESEVRALKEALSAAKAQEDFARKALEALEKKASDAQAAEDKADHERKSQDVRKLREAELREATRRRDEAHAQAAERWTQLERLRARLKELRDAQTVRLSRFNHHFSALVHHLVGSDARGDISIDGNGLHTKVTLGGERSTAAIQSLKVIAFDLAALLLAIEDKAHLPAFLVHDSPREADLGLSIYHPIFTLIRQLEAHGPEPAFQYIITTTTQPPTELQELPWLRLELHGAPKEKRLLTFDL